MPRRQEGAKDDAPDIDKGIAHQIGRGEALPLDLFLISSSAEASNQAASMKSVNGKACPQAPARW